MNQPGVSIIICTHNGSKKIIPTLDAIAKQSIPVGVHCELLLVDNASTDSTSDIALNYWNSMNSSIPLRIIPELKPGKSHALITGYDAAKYELMLLCDDDNWLQPDYVKTVVEIYSEHPDIGLLGGYGHALLDPGEKPDWFDANEQTYVCGKYHQKNGFLKPLKNNIWGAGSILRKKMWEFIRSNGFAFYHSREGGKALSEDAELSMAIMFTGHRMYFDDRLQFTHDLRGGRINRKSFIEMHEMTGKNRVALYMYQLAYDKDTINFPFLLLYFKQILLSVAKLTFFVMIGKTPETKHHVNGIREMIFNYKKYKKLSQDSSDWVKRIKNTLPLAS